MNILLAGQSILDRLWQEASSGEPSPAANTYLWTPGSPGSWGAPVNSLIQLTNALAAATGKEVRIFPGAQEGASLFQCGANSGTPTWWWLNETDATSPLVTSLAMISQAGLGLDAVVFLDGEGETRTVCSMTPDLWQAGLCKLHAMLAVAAGKSPDELPFVVVPLGAGETNFLTVRRAQDTIGKFPGMLLGPEYWDLPQDPLDPPHLSQPGRDAFALRLSAFLSPLLAGIQQTSCAGSFTRDASLASGTQTISGLPFTPSRIVFAASVAGTPMLSNGTDDGTTAACTYTTYEGGAGSSTSASAYIYSSGSGNGYTGRISAFPANGFTVNWTKIASAAGTINVNYTAYK